MSRTSLDLMEKEARRKFDRQAQKTNQRIGTLRRRTPPTQLKAESDKLYEELRSRLVHIEKRIVHGDLFAELSLDRAVAIDVVEAALDRFRQLGWTADLPGQHDGQSRFWIRLTAPTDWMERLLTEQPPARRRLPVASRRNT